MPTTITGTDGVSQVQTGAVESGDLVTTLDLTGKNLTLPSGAIGSGDLPAGSVIQVVHTTDDTPTTITSTGFQSVPLSLSITPLFASSSILILSNFNIGQDGDDGRASQGRFTRNGSGVGSFITGRDLFDKASNFNVGVQLVDTPATTSSVQYQLELRGLSSATQVRYLYENNSFPGSISEARLTLMEIAG